MLLMGYSKKKGFKQLKTEIKTDLYPAVNASGWTIDDDESSKVLADFFSIPHIHHLIFYNKSIKKFDNIFIYCVPVNVSSLF